MVWRMSRPVSGASPRFRTKKRRLLRKADTLMIPMAAAIEAVDRVCEQLGVILDIEGGQEARGRRSAGSAVCGFGERAFFGLGGE